MRIGKNIKVLKNAAALLIVFGLLVIMAPPVVQAANISPGGLPDVKSNTNTVRTIMGIAFGIIGSFALLSMTLSGFKYITSAGDPQKTSEAKSGIVYSLVGLMIAIAAEAIVVFVIKRTGSP